MIDISQILNDSLHQILSNLELKTPIELHAFANILDAVDSFSIVDLLLETEGRLEDAIGHYIPLADETIFDAEKSPLRNWTDWTAYVEKRIAE